MQRIIIHALDCSRHAGIRLIVVQAKKEAIDFYKKLGFVPEYELVRFEGIARPVNTGPVLTEAVPELFADMIDFDRRMTGTNRAKMLSLLFEEFPQNTRILPLHDKIDGFVTMRPGANAVQIGPCTANINAGPALLSDALDRCAGKAVFVDMPTGNIHAVKIAESRGLQIQRRFTRMCRGERINDDIKAIWAGSGPEKG